MWSQPSADTRQPNTLQEVMSESECDKESPAAMLKGKVNYTCTVNIKVDHHTVVKLQ